MAALTRSKGRQPKQSLWTRARLCVEQLEDRNLLAAALQIPGHILVAYDNGGKADVQEVQLGQGQSVADAIQAYSSAPGVLYAEPDYELHTQVIPNDPSFGSLDGL